MAIAWKELFDDYGVKTVTKTDKLKEAYVPTKAQVAAIEGAGIRPSTDRPASPFDLALLLDEHAHVTASYYYSQRLEPGRTPEPRIGREFIRTWLNVNDEVVIGRIGAQLFAARVRPAEFTVQELAQSVAAGASAATSAEIMKRAKKVKGKPKARSVNRTEYARNPLVVIGALTRAEGVCEMPACTSALFSRENGQPYLEIHHVVTLAEGGDDTLDNVAALCPHCHRELHHGKHRLARRALLEKHLKSLIE